MSVPGDFAALFEAVPDALVLVDESGLITRVNSHAERLFGYPPGTLAGLRVEVLIPEAVRERHHDHRAAYMSNPRVRPMGDTDQTLIGQRLDGHQFPLEIALSPIGYGDDPHYLASVRDVSESQRARQAQLRAGYDTLVARIGQLALESTDGETLVQILPELLAEALQVSGVAIAFGRRDSDSMEIKSAFGVGEDWEAIISSTAGHTKHLWALLDNGTPIVIPDLAGQGRDLPFADRLGGSCAVVPLLDRRRPMGALIALSRQRGHFGHDALHLLGSAANLLAALVQRRRTEEQLIHAQRLDAIGKMTGGVAHDFNNLLTIISGNLQLLEIQSQGKPALTDLIDSAGRAANRAAELTGKLLTFARRQRLVPQPIEPRARLEEIVHLLRRTLAEAVTLSVECPEGLPCALADVTQLDTALINLALNARDAMPHGGAITMRAEERRITDSDSGLKPGRYIVFSVIDTGQGMSEEVQRRAIEPFFTTKAAGRGSGLGLSMVYGFAEQSGGALRIESRLGYGARVDLTLPLASGTEPVVGIPTPGPVAGTGQTLLVVEDDDEVRNLARTFLSALGYRSLPASNAAEALAQLQSDAEIALLFTDVRLGAGANGIELATRARMLRPDIGILLTSGYAEADLQSEGTPDGFEMLAKPYRREQLAAAISRNLRPPVSQGIHH
jgi:PAS domain S-box-containing protein